MTFGTAPDRPHESYGYIETGSELVGGFSVKRFVEKPSKAVAQAYLDAGCFYWNVGMFCYKAGQAKVLNGEREFVIGTNESTYVPAGNLHRLENETEDDLVITEVQSGSYLGEDAAALRASRSRILNTMRLEKARFLCSHMTQVFHA